MSGPLIVAPKPGVDKSYRIQSYANRAAAKSIACTAVNVLKLISIQICNVKSNVVLKRPQKSP